MYYMEKNVVINGDALVELKKIPDDSVDLIFADPPYWMRVEGVLHRVEGTEFDGCVDEWDNQFTTLEDYENFTEKWLSECKRVLKKDGSIWVIGGMQCIYTIGAIMQRIGFWLINDVIWYKKNPTPNFRGVRLNNSHETLIWATKSQKSKFTFNYKTAKELNKDTVSEEEYRNGVRKQLGSVWRIGICQGNERLKDDKGEKLHSTQKPEELLYRIIAISSKVGDLVLDPFAGTMTTGVVAKRMGRNYIMIEKDKKYCEYGEKRLASTVTHIGDIEKAKFDEKPPKVTMQQMIQDGYFIEGESFFLKNKSAEARLKANGKLVFRGEEMDMHSCAAKAKGGRAKRVNGYNYWYVIRNGKLKSIDDIRKEYLKNKYGFVK
ncbi:MAG: site-specific DNA-methyltransferase [Clostridia bacterium]|nr:site-specific DNA-methyltransferase [Clostridia bacterium]